MKNTLFFTFFALAIGACHSPQPTSGAAATEVSSQPAEAASYGQAVAAASAAIPAESAPRILQDKDSVYLTLSGTAISSCTKKGCWMLLDLGQGESMRVTFKEYAFFVPKDLQGERVVVEGMLSRKISTADEQRHYAEDAGKPLEVINAIQQADTAYAFEAVGVLVYPADQK